MHESVMLMEAVAMLAVQPGGSYVDGTLGNAGHARELLRRAGPQGRLLGIDRDPEALERARIRLAGEPGRSVLAQGNHGDLAHLAATHGFAAVQGVLLDLGVSSEQLDTPARGFSFQQDGPLDMRMDPTGGETAAGLLARLSTAEMADLFRRLGDEPLAGPVARAIDRARAAAPVQTTSRLAEIIATTVVRRPPHVRRQTQVRVFQSLRMAVNGELDALTRALEAGLRLLAPDGRMVVITFESLTDRIVKHTFAAHAGRMLALPQGGARWTGARPPVALLARRPQVPGESEVARNPRSRSAKLRGARRLTASEAQAVTGGDGDESGTGGQAA
jgi:16S rRNA (cytosine1402-N4)-methyltransferase